MLSILFTILEKIKIDQDLLQVINMAFLTILIPVAIAIFRDRKEFEDLDKNVILEYVVQAKYFLFYLALMFLPLLFWNISSGKLRLFELFIWILGIYFIIRILHRSYYWMKGNKFVLRFNYLSNLENRREMEESWGSVWKTQKITTQNEENFFEIFSSTINKFLGKKDKFLTIVSKLLGDFNNFVELRSTILLTKPRGVFSQILEWHFIIWRENYKYLGEKDKLDEWGNYNEILRTLDSILIQIQERALQERMSFSFFDNLKKHVEEYKKEHIGDHWYVDYLFHLNGFCQKLFENIPNSPENHIIWDHYFPKEWKVAKKNLEKNKIISRIMLNCFLEWSRDRICREDSEKYDPTLDEVLKELFPEVDPVIFTDILVFAMCPWSGKRTEYFINRKRNFGLVGRVRTFGFNFDPFDEETRKKKEKEAFERMEKTEKEEKQKAIELGYYLFRNQFTSQKLEEYIKELEELKGNYKEDSIEENKRRRLERILREMSKLVKS